MKQKIILINLPPAMDFNYDNAGSIYPATGILLIGTIIKNKGLKVQVIDGALKSDYERKALASIGNDTLMVGFSVMTSQVTMALNLSKLIKKKHPNIPIVWGGIHPILFPEQTVKNSNIDIVVRGDGAETVSDLIDYFKGNRSIEQIRGIGFKDISGNVIFTEQVKPDDINNIPHINYEILDDIELYLNTVSVYRREFATTGNKRLRFMPILTGLGCCYKCQFCINVFLKRGYRFRSAVSIIEEIKRLQSEYSANAFIFYDEDFLISKRRLFEFLDLIEKENLKFYWRIWARADYFKDNYLNKDLICRLEKCGLRSIVMGAESGSQKILDLIQKGIKLKNILHSANMLNGTKITPRYSFIVGLDGEKKEDTLATYKLCAGLLEANSKVDIAGPFVFRYYPGSPIFDRIISKYNIKVPENIEDWNKSLHKEGFLKIDEMPWIWHGCMEVVAILNNGIFIFNHLRKFNNLLSKSVRQIILWRLRNLYSRFLIEFYVYNLLMRYYLKYLSIRGYK